MTDPRPLRELMDLKGRVALVTGACGGIGSVLASTLAELGAAVAVLDLDPEDCARTAGRLAAEHGVQASALAADLAEEAAVRQVPKRVRAALGGLDVVVHCAALVGTSALEGWAVPLAQQSAQTWRRALEVNLTAPFVLTQECSALLRASRHASVIFVSSIYGLLGPDWRLYEGTALGNPAAYAASKGGLLQLTRWFATTLAPEVRVNALSPGGVLRDQPQAFLDRYRERTPLRRLATEDDLRGAVAFLASDLSAYVTGHNLVVDGGWTSW